MKVTVKLYGLLRGRYPDYEHEKGIKINIAEGTTIFDLIITMGFCKDEVGLILCDGKIISDVCLVVNANEIVEFFSQIPHGG